MPEEQEGLTPEEIAAQQAAQEENPEGNEGTGEGEEENEGEGGEAKPKKSVQERINELTFKFREAERDADRWKTIAEAKETPEEKPARAVSDRPSTSQFETVEEYEDALYGWYDRKRQQKQVEVDSRENQRVAFEKFNKNATGLREQHEDFDAAIKAPVFTDAMRSIIFSIDNGAMIAYHLGKNPEVADKIKVLSPERQMYEISKLENKLLLAQKTKKVTTAPAPFETVGDSGGGETDPDKMTTAQWMKWDKERSLQRIKDRLEGKR